MTKLDNKPRLSGDISFGKRKVDVIRHTIHVSKDTGRDVHSVRLRFGADAAQFAVELENLDGLIDELQQAREWLHQHHPGRPLQTAK